ncbi:MAG: flagellar assembly peptidoglycan hydrolase FlgJ [Burkholderiales bacterium]
MSATTGDAGALDALRDPSGSALRARASSDPKAAIKMAAKQFEAMFMQQLMKSMRDSSLNTGMLENAGTQMSTEMLDTQFANKMSGAPGGLADVIARQLERQMSGVTAQAAVPAASAAGAPLGKVATVKPSQEEFLRMHTESAAGAEAQTGIPAAFMVAQAAHESGWGKHEIKNADGSNSHNLFGIKAGASWKGKVATAVTTEVVNGQPHKVVAKFRAYASYDESFRDYAQLMKDNPRYSKVVAAGNSAQGFAQGLQRAGYATDPAYADKLTRVINTTLRMQRASLRAPDSLA